jgi:hypothetical protein
MSAVVRLLQTDYGDREHGLSRPRLPLLRLPQCAKGIEEPVR